MSELTMTSNQPYLLKAFFDWIVDNELTPHLVIDATMENVRVPLQYVNDGQIVLNVSPSACMNFHMSPEGVSFQARFGGQPHYIDIPCCAVLAIYARENGAGTVFTPDSISEDSDDITIPQDDNEVETLQSTPKELVEVKTDTPNDNPPSKTKKDRKRPVFTVVK